MLIDEATGKAATERETGDGMSLVFSSARVGHRFSVGDAAGVPYGGAG